MAPLKLKSAVCVARYFNESLGSLCNGDCFKLEVISNGSKKEAILKRPKNKVESRREKYKPTSHSWITLGARALII